MKIIFSKLFMKTVATLFIIYMMGWQPVLSSPLPLIDSAAEVYHRAQEGHWFADATKLQPDIVPTSDGRSFIVIWKATKDYPKHWIVSLHGSQGFATDDLALWYPHLKNRDVGLVSVQWWIGTDNTPQSYYTPTQIYHEIDVTLQKLGVKPGTAMLHGFSRGSANSYAVAALDAGRGKHYFSLFVASSGGVSINYPPTQAILTGELGDHPLRNTRWITVAGARDPDPYRSGIPGMKRTADWLQEQGARVIESIEDPNEGHGAFKRNAKNVHHVLDLFLNEKL